MEAALGKGAPSQGLVKQGLYGLCAELQQRQKHCNRGPDLRPWQPLFSSQFGTKRYHDCLEVTPRNTKDVQEKARRYKPNHFKTHSDKRVV